MPSVSQAQARLMAACAHGASYSNCPPAKVAHDFNQADKGRDIKSLPKRKSKLADALLAKMRERRG